MARSIIVKALAIITIALIISCSDAKRLQRIAARHPDWVFNKEVTKTDTIITKEIKKDTLFQYNEAKVHDTIILNNERLSIKYIRSHDTIRLQGQCKADTIIRKVKVDCPPQVKAVSKSFIDKLMEFFGLVFLIILLLFLIDYFRKKKEIDNQVNNC